MKPYCDCGACCDSCGHDDDCAARETADDTAGYDHDAYTL